MYLGSEPDDVITPETVEKHGTPAAVGAVAHLVTCLSLPALSLGAGMLYISDGLWCVTGQNQRTSLVSDHHVVLNPDTQAAETLWHLVIVLADVQPWFYSDDHSWLKRL